MAQTSTWAVPSAPSGLAMRNTVNTINEVLRSSSSGAAAPSPTVAGMFWFDESVSPAVLRIRNSSNTEWIRIIDTADAAASRSALGATATGASVFTAADAAAVRAVIGAMPGPDTLGRQTFGGFAINTAAVLPAGGTWYYWLVTINLPSGTWDSLGAGVVAGGTQVAAAQGARAYFGEAWRRQ